uniref:Chromosome 10 open reading frame 105 n=1 Tax=Malurus cyaneus samueli TaxID=2593467 RepID=A0A8C5UAM4_9PASS
MSTEGSANSTSPTSPLLPTMEWVPPSAASPEVTAWLPVIIGLLCILLVLATFLTFVTACKPAALGWSLPGHQECLPHHPVDASEPQLRLWKRLGSLRCSISSFRRSQLLSQSQLACPRSFSASQDWDTVESTKM